MKKLNTKDGFTLVEMLAVLVIMALLAAATIPSMTGFIRDTKRKAELSEARVVYIAAQAAVSEYAAMNEDAVPGELSSDSNHPIITSMNSLINNDATGSYRITVNTDNRVTRVEYQGTHGTIVINESGVELSESTSNN